MNFCYNKNFKTKAYFEYDKKSFIIKYNFPYHIH